MIPAIDTAEMFTWLLATLRAVAMFELLPLFAMASVPRIMRVAFSALLGWMVAPLAAHQLAYPTSMIELVLLVAKELSIGMLMGLSVRMVFYAIDAAAAILALQIGFNPGPEFNPTGSADGNPLGVGLSYLGLALFIAGAHYAVLFAFSRSFELVPPGLQAVDTHFVDVVVRHTARIVELGVLMAAPILATNFIINLAFSLLGRVVSRMNVFVISFSVRIAAGLAMLAASVGLIAHYILQQFGGAPELMLRYIPFRAF